MNCLRRKARPLGGPCYRAWAELRDLRDGSKRRLELRAVRRVHLLTRRGDPQPPDQHRLILEDGAQTIEASQLDELIAQLRTCYPDGMYERYLHYERDEAAETTSQALYERLIQEIVRGMFTQRRARPSPHAPR